MVQSVLESTSTYSLCALIVIASEEQQKRLQAEKVRKTKEAIEEARKTTVDDLTNGIVFYKYLGLDFERTQVENQLRYVPSTRIGDWKMELYSQ